MCVRVRVHVCPHTCQCVSLCTWCACVCTHVPCSLHVYSVLASLCMYTRQVCTRVYARQFVHVCRVHVFVHACVRVYTCRQPLSWRPTERGLPVAPGRPFLTRRVLNWGPLPGSRDPPKASLSRPFICQIPVILFKAILQPK